MTAPTTPWPTGRGYKAAPERGVGAPFASEGCESIPNKGRIDMSNVAHLTDTSNHLGGQQYLDPRQFLTPSADAAFAIHKAGLAGVPLPTEPSGFDSHYVDQCSVASMFSGREVVVQSVRTDEEGTTSREVELLTVERDDAGSYEFGFCEGVTLSLGQAREVAQGLLLAIAAHEVDQSRGADL